jgi:hypothetical protein
MTGMTDPKQVRLNDGDDPDRSSKFQLALRRTEANGNAVLRRLVDAYLAYVAEHGHGPAFPVKIVELKTKACAHATELK